MTEAEKYLEKHELPRDYTYGLFSKKSNGRVLEWEDFLQSFADEQVAKALKEVAIYDGDFECGMNHALEQIEKSLDRPYHGFMPNGDEQRSKTQSVINRLKKG